MNSIFAVHLLKVIIFIYQLKEEKKKKKKKKNRKETKTKKQNKKKKTLVSLQRNVHICVRNINYMLELSDRISKYLSFHIHMEVLI